MDKNDSYLFGILITDGSLYLTTRNRGKVQLEISKKDEDLIDKLINLVPNSIKRERTRVTNFSNGLTNYVSFVNHRKGFRDKLIEEGFPISNKTENASIPLVDYDEVSFWRGVIDGDGSVGITSQNEPFVSLITKSENLKNEYLKFLYKKFGILKKLNRNKRDNVYNIIVKNKNAKELVKLLYDNDDLHLNRKYNKAMMIIKSFNY
jgi:hypothetical protein